MIAVTTVCLAVLAVGAALCVARLVRAESIADRVLALDTLLIVIVVGVGVNAARTGSVAGNGSGDLFLAFSTANPGASKGDAVARLAMLPNVRMDPLFEATVQATEEAILNALVAAQTMVGRDDHRVLALPHDRLRAALKKYNRLSE